MERRRSQCKSALFLFFAFFNVFASGLMPRNRMSDPVTDADNMIEDDAGFDPSVIPSHLVMQEDPMSFDEAPGLPLDPNDFSQAEKLNDIMFDESYDEDPTLMANLFQGDIWIRNDDELFALSAHATLDGASKMNTKNAIIKEESKWKKAIIPYQISSNYDSNERATIAKAIAEIHQFTCIRFVSKTNEEDYIFIKKASGCSSAVGRVGRSQTVSLGVGCVYFGIIIHELLHAIGLWHEQSRADRNSYVNIYYANIKAGMDYNFQKYDWSIIQNLGISYDTDSIMHYGENAFAKDRSKPTIRAINGAKIGQRNNLSKKDIEKINRLYKCSATTIHPTVVTQKPLPPIPVPDKCVDYNQFCSEWAKVGECDTNRVWMNPNCRKSCNQCGKCSDENVFCPQWSQQGECFLSSDYMMYHCKKSCNLCTKGGATNCVDENEYCDKWAKAGECAINPRYMKKNCKKSCNTC